jgi:acyl-CoA synthetase (AMP-forming)/AMP-acid ligase II
VYLPQFDPEAWVETARSEDITHAMVVPTMLGRILDVLESHGDELVMLRHLSYGGGRMPAAVIERAMKLLPEVGFVNAYGLTETSSTIAILTPEDHRDPRRLGSVGKPLSSIEVEVRDGEIWVRGEQISGEYLGRGAALTADGWFRTNDAGWLDDDGYLFVEGRLDDVIVRGGENLSPGEIEDVLLLHPAISDAAVVGVPDQEWGEAVAAIVVLHAGASVTDAQLQAWVRDRLRSARTPARVEFRDELPYNETGKLLRRVLKAELSR